MPFCTPKDGPRDKLEDLGEVLEGDRLVSTPYVISFLQDVENEVMCSKALTVDELKKFRDAVKQDYYFRECSSTIVSLSCLSQSISL